MANDDKYDLDWSHWRQIDRICVEAEQAWNSGCENRIEDYLGDYDGAVRKQLLSELLALEVHFRVARGEEPSSEEFCSRFPHDADLVLAVFERRAGQEDSAGKIPALPDRYEFQAEIGRGGMGTIWRVIDRQFDRALALKCMLPGLASDPNAVARFEREARLTGTLQHPAIPPVIDRGLLTSGVPYFSMKLVEGQTLQALLGDNAEKNAASNLPHLLAVFEQVCHAVGFAHARNVIHRDLKPSNIMVGEFGEVQVMDWGMAKHLREDTGLEDMSDACERRPAEPRGDTDRGADFETVDLVEHDASIDSAGDPKALTREGNMMGTLAYMPPEQARGELSRIDSRSDVFSLGAILCELLTGLPPFAGNLPQVRELAKQCDTSAAFRRLDASGADPALIQLTKDCLAESVEERPASGRTVGNRIADFQAAMQKRLRREELGRVAAEVRAKGERKARRLTVGVAGLAVVLLIGLGGVSTWRVVEQRIEAAENHRIVTGFAAAMDDFRDALENQAFESAEASLQLAKGQVATRNDDQFQKTLKQAETDLATARKLAGIRIRFSEVRFDGIGRDEINAAYRKAFSEYGIDLTSAESAKTAIADSDIRTALQDALEYWGLLVAKSQEQRDVTVLNIARQTTSDPWRQKLVIALIDGDTKQLKELAADSDGRQASSLTLLSEALALQGESVAAEQLLIKLHQQSPDDFWANNDFGVFHALFSQRPNWHEAARYFQAAHALNPDRETVLVNLCNALEKSGRYQEAVAVGLKAIELAPESAIAHANLGNAYTSLGNFKKGTEHSLRGFELDPDMPEARNSLGRVYIMTRRLPLAVEVLRPAAELAPNHAEILGNLGAALAHTAPAEAIEVLQRAIEAFRQLGSTHDMAIAQMNLGTAYVGSGDEAEAIKAYQMAIAISPQFAEAYVGLGDVYFKQKRIRQAIEEYDRALKIHPGHPSATWNKRLCQGLTLIASDGDGASLRGDDFMDQGNPEKAIQEYREAIELDPTEIMPYLKLAVAYQDLGKFDHAVAVYRDALKIAASDRRLWTGLGLCLLATDREAEAAQCFRKAIDLAPRNQIALMALGMIHFENGKPHEAIPLLEKATQNGIDNAEAWTGLGTAYWKVGRLTEAATCLARARKLAPENLETLLSLAEVQFERQEYAASIELCRQCELLDVTDNRVQHLLARSLLASGRLREANHRSAIALAGTDLEPEHYVTRGRVLNALGDYVSADVALTDAVQQWPTHAPARFFLAQAQLNQGLFAEATANLQLAGALGFDQSQLKEGQIRCDRLIALADRLESLLDQPAEAAAEDLVDCAWICLVRKRFDEAVRLYRVAFGRDSLLFDDRAAKHRLHAAVAAANAGCELKNASQADESAALRQLALGWLQDELSNLREALDAAMNEPGFAIRRELERWKADPRLKCIREDREHLPPSEVETWGAFWIEVDLTLGSLDLVSG